MNKFKKSAYKLRKQEKSYGEISRQLGIPKSTLSYWFKTDSESLRIKKILIKKAQKRAAGRLRKMALAHKEKWRKIHLSYRRQADGEFLMLISQSFFGPGLMLYWGEGDKKLRNGIVRIANTDYRMLKIFIAFLTNSCQVQPKKIRVWLLLYPDLDEKKCKKYWRRMLNVSKKQFVKSQYILGRERKRKVDYGVCTVQVYSRELKEKIIEWIDLYSERLDQAGIV